MAFQNIYSILLQKSTYPKKCGYFFLHAVKKDELFGKHFLVLVLRISTAVKYLNSYSFTHLKVAHMGGSNAAAQRGSKETKFKYEGF